MKHCLPGPYRPLVTTGLDLALADDDKPACVDISFDEDDEAGLDLDLTGARQGPASDLLDFDLGSADDTSMMQTEIAPRNAGAGGLPTGGPTVEAPWRGRLFARPWRRRPSSRGASTDPPLKPPRSRRQGRARWRPRPWKAPFRDCVPARAIRAATGSGDQTEEINLEDLGLDLTGLDEAAGELGTGAHGALDLNRMATRTSIGTPASTVTPWRSQ